MPHRRPAARTDATDRRQGAGRHPSRGGAPGSGPGAGADASRRRRPAGHRRMRDDARYAGLRIDGAVSARALRRAQHGERLRDRRRPPPAPQSLRRRRSVRPAVTPANDARCQCRCHFCPRHPYFLLVNSRAAVILGGTQVAVQRLTAKRRLCDEAEVRTATVSRYGRGGALERRAGIGQHHHAEHVVDDQSRQHLDGLPCRRLRRFDLRRLSRVALERRPARGPLGRRRVRLRAVERRHRGHPSLQVRRGRLGHLQQQDRRREVVHAGRQDAGGHLRDVRQRRSAGAQQLRRAERYLQLRAAQYRPRQLHHVSAERDDVHQRQRQCEYES